MMDGNAVYVSFNRCEDTIRHSFLSHISAEFHRRRITCEYHVSDHDRVPEERDAAIAKSKVSLVILSEEYAFSKQCLDELLNVSECRANNDLVVVPVFYGFTKSALRKQCLKLKNKYPDDRVADWRRTLLEIADLPGHASSLERSDSELVQEIVADVRQKLDLTSMIGIYPRLMEIENLLCKQPWSVHSLGIWGMGGIGKSTLAEEAFKQLSGDYEAACFIKDFDIAFQERGAYGLLEEHLGKKLGLKNPVTREKLRHKRIMVVLDDVHKPVGATTFLSWFDLLGPRSLIIITSRDKQLLVQCRVKDIYEVQGLDELEAQQLFSQRVIDEINSPKLVEYKKNLLKLVEYANGNPLALRIYCSELEGKKPPELDSAVLELKGHLSDKIFDAFKKSYDALSDSEKEIFLLIVCFLRGENVEYVMQLLSGCGFFPHVGIDALVDKGLVFLSDNRVKMHDLIYDVGLKIIRDQREETEMGYRFLDASNIQSIQEENEEPKDTPKQETEDIKAITLDASNLASTDQVAFQHMYNLRYMKIIHSSEKNHDFCPQSMPLELRLLHWENYPFRSFPLDFDDIQHLVELNMPYSNLKKLWEGNKSLEMLKRVTLRQSKQLENVDELRFSRNIEEIDLQGCSRLKRFPDMGQSQHLRVVNLSACIEINGFPNVPSSIKKLHLQGTNIRELPFMNYSSESKGLSDDQSHLEGLTSQVNVSSSNQIMVTFESLEVLNLSGCLGLEVVKGFPPNLKELYLAKTSIKEISSSLCHLSQLVTLDVEDCKQLMDLPMGMSDMTSLTTLKLSGCSMLEKIQDLPENLKELYLTSTAVREYPSSLGDNLSKL
ncbi:hypothetical protein CARUB_v10004129mg, partial [Capsella rubella]